MNPLGTETIWIGLVIVGAAAAAMYLLVHRELAPQGALRGRGEWWLAAGLGLGVAAFVVKLAAAVVFSLAPDIAIAPLIAHLQARLAMVPDAPAAAPPAAGRAHWQPLPLQAPAPPDNPPTPEKIALGERLFNDPALSADGRVACASCHDVRGGSGADGRRTSRGIGGQTGARNAPTVFNAAFQPLLFWDGRAASLEEQAKGPLVNPVEMGMASLAEVEARVRADARYRDGFARAFGAGAPVTIDRIAQAIASYERTLVTPDAPYDRFLRGERDALTTAQLRGMALFESAGCASCHAGSNFSGAGVYDAPALWRTFPTNATPYDARYALTADRGRAAPGATRGLWRVPSLRNVELTAPYLHNGSVDTLEETVRVMAAAQLGRALAGAPAGVRDAVWSSTDGRAAVVERRALSEEEVGDLVAFLQALTSERLRAARVQCAAGCVGP